MNDFIIKDTGVIVRAELDTQISTAKAYPRNLKESLKNMIEMITIDQETAESCFYCLTRNGKEGKVGIKGPSIRLAEIAKFCWKNMHAATRIIENDGKFITAEAVVWDLENNNKDVVQQKRSIQRKEGGTFTTDMQVVTGQAASSIALRTCIIRVIGLSYINIGYKAAMNAAIGDQKTFEARRKEVFNRLNKMGIETQRILSFFDKSTIDEFDMDDVADLIGIGTSIKDGTLSIDKAFSFDNDDLEKNAEERLRSLLHERDN